MLRFFDELRVDGAWSRWEITVPPGQGLRRTRRRLVGPANIDNPRRAIAGVFLGEETVGCRFRIASSACGSQFGIQ